MTSNQDFTRKNSIFKENKALPVGRQTPPGKVVQNKIHNLQGGTARDVNDHTRLRQGRERHLGFDIGKYIQPPPMIFTRDGHAIYCADMYRGCPAFLIGGGPSFAEINSALLNQPGILTLAMNNAVKSFRPNLWTSVDDPTHFIKSVWVDPKIMKFVPFCHAEKPIFDSNSWEMTDIKVGDCPNIWFYRRNEHFIAKQFLFEDTFNWGDHKDFGGARSIMLVSIRILFYLGIRTIFLLGVDFKMDEKTKYHFDQDRSKSSINSNNSSYSKLISRFTELNPLFLQNDLHIFNCNLASELKVFPYKPFNEAIEYSLSDMPKDLANERTEGLYERTAKKK